MNMEQSAGSVNFVSEIGVRTIITRTEEVFVEGGRRLPESLRKAVVCAVIANPWAGQGYVDDLWSEMNRVGGILFDVLGARLIDLLGGPDEVRGFGKCAVVGVDGEIEHGAGILHGPNFGPRFRAMVNGSAGIPFTERRSAPGATISIPTGHKTHASTRAYYQAVDMTFEDAPHPGEIAIAIAGVSGPRPHERVGDLRTDEAWSNGLR